MGKIYAASYGDIHFDGFDFLAGLCYDDPPLYKGPLLASLTRASCWKGTEIQLFPIIIKKNSCSGFLVTSFLSLFQLARHSCLCDAKVSSSSEFERRFKCLGGRMTIFVRVFALPVPFLSLLLALSLTHERQHETKIYGGGRSGGEGGYRGRDGQGGGGQCGRRRQHAWCVLLLQIWQMCACIRGLIYLCMHMPPTHARPYTRTDTATQRHRDTETQRHRDTEAHIYADTRRHKTPRHIHTCTRARHTHNAHAHVTHTSVQMMNMYFCNRGRVQGRS